MTTNEIFTAIATNQIFLSIIFILCFSGVLVAVGFLFGWFTPATSEQLAVNRGGYADNDAIKSHTAIDTLGEN